MKSYLDTDRVPLPFCPGCGHTSVVKALDRALVSLDADPAGTVVVTDIGCIGLSDKSFLTSAFHGLHGRALTYATGLKLARPELSVIVLMGDGGLGIGGTHFLNAARRNIGVTLLIANNMNFGMTGGQHSVTTPAGALTSTTPEGNREQGLDLCAVAAAAGAPWVRRATSFDEDLAEGIAAAIRHPGFAVLDIFELCTAWFAPRNRYRRSELLALLDRLELPLGILADRTRPELSATLAARKLHLASPPSRIEVEFSHSLSERQGIVVCGSAGQKVLSAAGLFARAAISSGLDVLQKDDYPITVQTGHSLAELVLSPSPMEDTVCDPPDHLLLLSEEGLGRVKGRLAGLDSRSTIWAEGGLGLPATGAAVRRFPFVSVAREAGRHSLPLVALTVLLHATGLFPADALRHASALSRSGPRSEADFKAIAAGLSLIPLHPPRDTGR